MLKVQKISQKDSREKRIQKFSIRPFVRGSQLYLRLTYNKKNLSFSTGLSCPSSKLDAKTFSIKGNEQTTIYLQQLRTDIERVVADFRLTKRPIDLRELKKIAVLKETIHSTTPTLNACLDIFFKNDFESLSGIDYKAKTVEKKRYLVERIKRYVLEHHKNPYLKLTELKPVDGQNLVNFCKKNFGHGHNHAVLHAEFLKRTLNYAIANEWIDKNPLAFFRPKRERKEVEALSEGEILNLQQTVFHGHQYNYVKDVFLFCCYTGLSYIDVSRLDNTFFVTLKNGDKMIKIGRGKNENPCIIPLVPQALEILDKYAENEDCLSRERLLPVYANQVMNRILKEIQAICHIKLKLTTHVARKTCASYFIANGVPLTSVATMLGHKKTSTTELYYTQRTEEAVIRHIQEFKERKGLDNSKAV
ncbi:site-specific integrase [Runella rosea]|nr:site-specific integrase [Runella rosea]